MTKQKIFLIGAIILFIFLISWLVIGCPPFKKCPGVKQRVGTPPTKVILKIVGPWDSEKDWAEIASRFKKYKSKKENGFLDVIVQYKKLPSLDYENTVKEMQFEGNGPNIYMIFNSWLPRYKDKLLPMPKGMMSLTQYKNTFAKVAVDDFTTPDGNIYALPFYIDTLALYYNEDMFLNEGFYKAPETWDEFKNYVEKLTVLDKNGNIERNGATFGGGSEISRSQDIIILLAMQNNFKKDNLKSLVSFNNPESIAAIKFYTDFTNPTKRFYTWNENQMYSIDAFIQRKAAMMIGYSYNISNIKDKTGGTLNFKVAPIPQLDKNYKVNYASYWAPVVPKIAPCESSTKKINCYKLAWEFLNFAAKKENVKSYLDSTNTAAANLELAQKQASNFDDARSIFASQVFTAKSWDHPNDKESDKALVKMIDSIITKNKDKKKTIQEATDIAKKEVQALN